VRVLGLDPSSLQPDRRLGSLLEHLGCSVRTGEDWVEVEGDGVIPPFEVDLSDAPDLAPTLAVLALFAEGPCALRGVAHLRHKETDRLEELARNLRRLGREAIVTDVALEVGGKPRRLTGGPIGTAGDHRLAMAFAIAGLRLGGITIDDAACVAKSHPAFWPQFARLEG
jgi:3-phosphoshikimate 1-carboxyvinyltransferase